MYHPYCLSCRRSYPQSHFHPDYAALPSPQSFCRTCLASRTCAQCGIVAPTHTFPLTEGKAITRSFLCATCRKPKPKPNPKPQPPVREFKPSMPLPPPMQPIPLKRCKSCRRHKPFTEFALLPPSDTTGHAHESICIACAKIRTEKYAARYLAHVVKKRAIRRFHQEKMGKVPPGSYERLLEAQGHCCAICGRNEHTVPRDRKGPRRLSMDHDHVTGQLRGLLCTSCNWVLGKFHDSIPLFQNAIRYLRQHAKTQDRSEHQLDFLADIDA
jgi:hypothetical protein